MKKNLVFICSMALFASCSSNSNEQKDSLQNATHVKTNPDMVDFATEVDTDKDGKMSKSEWSEKGLPNSSFDMFEKGRGFVLIEDYQKNPAPDGIDINGDGKLTVAEFKEFDKIMSEKMKNGELPPPPQK